MLVEVCANSLRSALNAEKGGAARIELCAELGVGGITPSHGLIKQVKQQLTIPVHVLIRPRSGHFTYTDTEFEVMQADISFCSEIGVAGVAIGMLRKNGQIDIERLAELANLAKPMHLTFHRAFDWVPNPLNALTQLEGLGIDTVLTSGKYPNAANGIQNLVAWQQATTMTIMAGAGINPENAALFKKNKLRAIHLSATRFGNAVPTNRKLSMNSNAHLQEHHVAMTNEMLVQQVVAIAMDK